MDDVVTKLMSGDRALLSWLRKFVSNNKLIQITEAQLDTEAEKSVPLSSPWSTTTLVFGHFRVHSVGGGATFYRDRFRRVFLRGHAGGGTVGSQIGVLPAGYRPADGMTFPVWTDTGIGFVTIDADGVIKHLSGGTTTVRFDGISFRAT